MKEQKDSDRFAIKMTVEEQINLLLKGRDDDNNINVDEGGSSDPLRPHLYLFYSIYAI